MSRSVLPVIVLLTAAVVFGPAFSSPAFALDANLFTQFEYLISDAEIKNKLTGEVIQNDYKRFRQFYNLDASIHFAPNLALSGGGVLDLVDSSTETEGTKTDLDRRITRPYLDLTLRTPVYSAGVGYRRTEIRTDTTGLPTDTNTREQYNSILEWNPAGLPRVSFNYTRSRTSNEPETMNSVGDSFIVDSLYSYKSLFLSYNLIYDKREDRANDRSVESWSHSGAVSYARDFFDGRLSWSTNYNIDYSTFDTVGSTADIPVSAAQGLFSLDDTPGDGPALAQLPALVDGNLTTSSGIDIGSGTGETRQVNMGLDLSVPVPVDAIFVWVDRVLTPSVANSFVWEVYTSPDNTDSSLWTLRATVFPATFSSLENRFEIRFQSVEARFVKVVTRPLSPGVDGALAFPNIFVTEVGAFSTLSGGETFRRVNHRFTTALRWRLGSKTTAGYTLSYFLQESEPVGTERSFLTNGFDVNHVFSRIFAGTLRVLRSDEEIGGFSSVTNEVNILMRAAYLPTFSQSLAVSVSYVDDEQEGKNTNYSVVLRNNADLYRGWSVFLDGGYNQSGAGNSQTTSKYVRVGTKVIPNPKLTVDTDYQARWTTFVGEPSQLLHIANFQVFYSPFKTLTLFSLINVVDSRETTRVFQNYSVGWQPFPGGALQFFVNYNESVSSIEEQRTRSYGPGFNWRISRRTLLTLTYNIVESESETQTVDSNTLSANLKIRL